MKDSKNQDTANLAADFTNRHLLQSTSSEWVWGSPFFEGYSNALPHPFSHQDRNRVRFLMNALLHTPGASPSTNLLSQRWEFAQQRLLDRYFKVAVIATMSSGKSTLLNALLHQHLLPARSTSTTNQIIRIEDVDGMETFAGQALSTSGEIIAQTDILQIEDIEQWNQHNGVERLELFGDIDWVDNIPEGHIVFYDTPGPNTVQDVKLRKRLQTFLFTEHSETPDLLLYILDATRLRVDDDHQLLLQVLQQLMKKNSFIEDRCIFVLNKVDELDSTKDGELTDILARVRDYLRTHFSFHSPIVVPVSGLSGLLSIQIKKGHLLSERSKNRFEMLEETIDFREYKPSWLRNLCWKFRKPTLQERAHSLWVRSGMSELQALIEQALLRISLPVRYHRVFQILTEAKIVEPTSILRDGRRDASLMILPLENAWKRYGQLSPKYLSPSFEANATKDTSTFRLNAEPTQINPPNGRIRIQKPSLLNHTTSTADSLHNNWNAPPNHKTSQEASMASSVTVRLRHNPITLSSSTTVDGNSWHVLDKLCESKRIQGWFSDYIESLHKELRQTHISFVFQGISLDAADVREILKQREAEGAYSYNLVCEEIKFPIESLSAQLLNLLERIQSDSEHEGIALQDQEEILRDIRALLAHGAFRVAVLACVSSGKSTMLNAMLGQELLPARAEATTAKIIHLMDTSTHASVEGRWYNADGSELAYHPHVTKELLEDLNQDGRVMEIRLKTFIPWVSKHPMGYLELMDTPGPNNASDQEHRVRTYSVIKNTESAPDLVLYIMDYRRMEVEDDKVLLQKVSQEIRKGGFQANDRFLFVINCIDELDPEQDQTHTQDVMEKARAYLQKHFGITHPNVFPLSALGALYYRLKESEAAMTRRQRRRMGYFEDEMQSFEEMVEAAICSMSLKDSVRDYVSNLPVVNGTNGGSTLLARSGILLIEQAINRYLQKYSMPLKLARFYQEMRQKLLQDEKLRSFEASLLSTSENLLKVQSALHSLESSLHNRHIVSQIEDMLETEGNKLLGQKFAGVGRFEFQVTKFLSDSNLTGSGKASINEMNRWVSELESQVGNLAAEIEVDVRSQLEATLKQLQQNTIATFQQHLDKLLEQGDLKDIYTPDAETWSVNANLRLQRIVGKYQEERNFIKKHNRIIQKERAWYNPVKWLTLFDDSYKWYNEKEEYETKHTVHEVDKEKVRQAIQVDLMRQVRFFKNEANEHRELEFALFKSSIMELVQKIQSRVQNHLKALQDKMSEKNKLMEERNKAQNQVRALKQYLEELENIVSLEVGV